MEYTDENDENYLRIISNLSHTYNLRKDTLGLIYADKVLNEGIRQNNDHLKYIGAINASEQYCIRGDWEQAHEYIQTALGITDQFYSTAEVFSLYANILYHLGDNEKAELYFQKALSFKDNTEAAVMCGLYSNYGFFLLNTGRYDEAARIFQLGLDTALKTKSYMHRHELYLGLSETYGKLNDIEKELEYFKTFHFLSDSLFNAEKERNINELRVKYETEKVKHNLTISYLVIIFLSIAILSVIIMYINRQKRYNEQISRHYESYRREIAKKEADDGGKLAALFKQIEKLMNEEELWRKNDITIESLAKRLDSNRSYVSNAINKYAGIQFKHYINSFRISKAISMLSDPNDNTPLKAMYEDLGFNSTSSFYRSFQLTTGVPPSKYKKGIYDITNKELCHNNKN